MAQRDFATEHDEALQEYETAKEGYLNLSGTLTAGFAAVLKDRTANPPIELVEATEKSRKRFETAKERLHKIAIKWAHAA